MYNFNRIKFNSIKCIKESLNMIIKEQRITDMKINKLNSYILNNSISDVKRCSAFIENLDNNTHIYNLGNDIDYYLKHESLNLQKDIHSNACMSFSNIGKMAEHFTKLLYPTTHCGGSNGGYAEDNIDINGDIREVKASCALTTSTCIHCKTKNTHFVNICHSCKSKSMNMKTTKLSFNINVEKHNKGLMNGKLREYVLYIVSINMKRIMLSCYTINATNPLFNEYFINRLRNHKLIFKSANFYMAGAVHKFDYIYDSYESGFTIFNISNIPIDIPTHRLTKDTLKLLNVDKSQTSLSYNRYSTKLNINNFKNINSK